MKMSAAMTVHVYLPRDRAWIIDKAKELAEKKDRSLSWFIVAAIEKAVEKLAKEETTACINCTEIKQ